MDLKLDSKGDLILSNCECLVTQELGEVVAQRLFIRLRTFYSEWFLNVDYGVPYLESILGHKVSKDVVDRIIQENIYKERGVSEIVSFSSSLNGRSYSCTFRVRAEDGSTSPEIIVTQ